MQTLYAFGASGDVVGTKDIHYLSGMVVPQKDETVKHYYARYPKARNTINNADIGTMLFDCSGLVCYMLGESGIELDHRLTAAELQKSITKKSKPEELAPGNLLFQGNWHVGVYLGDNRVIEAAYPWIDSTTYGMRDGVQVCYIDGFDAKSGVITTRGETGSGRRNWQSFGSYNGFALSSWTTVFESDAVKVQVKEENLMEKLLH